MWKAFGTSASRHAFTSLIAEGAQFEGVIRFKGTLEIEGCVRGDVCATDDAQAVVRVLQSGQVFGNIDVPLIVINGSVTGNLRSIDHVELAARAVVNGDVHYNLIEMMKGAQVNGSLVFSEPGVTQAEAPAGNL